MFDMFDMFLDMSHLEISTLKHLKFLDVENDRQRHLFDFSKPFFFIFHVFYVFSADFVDLHSNIFFAFFEKKLKIL